MLYTPHPKQLEIHKSPKRFKALNWGRQTGKSFFALEYALIEALQSQGRYWIVLPTYRQAKDVYWHQYVKTAIPKELVEKYNEVDLSVTLKFPQDASGKDMFDRKQSPSTIELKGSDKADLLRGARVNGFVFDEYAYHDPNAWPLIFEPMLLVSRGWGIFISTPNGFNHWYDLCNKAQADERWLYSHATPYDNPYITNQEIERVKAERGEDEFAQEYMAEFRKMAGLVYKEFDRKIHMIKPEDVPLTGTNVIGIDFGFVNPTAAIFVRIDYDGNWWIFDEVYEKGKTINDVARILKDKMKGLTVRTIIGDSAQAEHIANLATHGLPVIPVSKTKDSISAGINLLKIKLKTYQQLSGKPRPMLYVSSDCQNIIAEFEKYSYPKRKSLNAESRDPKEDPLKKDDHGLDAIRYLALFYQQNPDGDFDFPEDELFNDGGFY